MPSGQAWRWDSSRRAAFARRSRRSDWLALMKDELGRPWLEPSLFRFGASGMLGDIERQLEHHLTGHYSATYRHPIA